METSRPDILLILADQHREGLPQQRGASRPDDAEHRRDRRRRNPVHAGLLDYCSGILANDWTALPFQLPERLHSTIWTVHEAQRFLARRDPTRPNSREFN